MGSLDFFKSVTKGGRQPEKQSMSFLSRLQSSLAEAPRLPPRWLFLCFSLVFFHCCRPKMCVPPCLLVRDRYIAKTFPQEPWETVESRCRTPLTIRMLCKERSKMPCENVAAYHRAQRLCSWIENVRGFQQKVFLKLF